MPLSSGCASPTHHFGCPQEACRVARIDCLQLLLPSAVITCLEAGLWLLLQYAGSWLIRSAGITQGAPRNSVCAWGLTGACNSPLYWSQRFMVANVALPLPLRCVLATTYMRCGAATEVRGPIVVNSSGPLPGRRGLTALCIHRANHEILGGPQEAEGAVPEVVGIIEMRK